MDFKTSMVNVTSHTLQINDMLENQTLILLSTIDIYYFTF
jgi:hypothetical protein